MKHLVLKQFVDKVSGVYYALGTFYVSEDYERVMELAQLGFVEANKEVSSLKKVEEKKTTRKKVVDKDVREG